ncbi:hypothetical protein BDA96_09G205300 [Sorghum bicolor]|uniref:Uncharacterized protein n=1 Tax=Sorghum bicolor TaxID=4558 RepID=A0A921QDJ4_SORBI|nr:hypothetical protein BDA96_09G205300 [Sorghum bicolor]
MVDTPVTVARVAHHAEPVNEQDRRQYGSSPLKIIFTMLFVDNQTLRFGQLLIFMAYYVHCTHREREREDNGNSKLHMC